jgi:hypothetical protein
MAKIQRNKTQKYAVSLTKENYKMLLAIHKELGSVSLSETWRQLISQKYKELFEDK